MDSHRRTALIACACAGATLLAATALAQVATKDAHQAIVAGSDAPASATAHARAVQAQHARLAAERRHYPVLFRHAYARYPRIPAGALEAIAFVQSRWHTLRPDRTGELDHPHMPPAWGVMGLYAGDGFADQAGEAAALLGTDARAVREDPRLNVLAAAALLDRAMRGTAIDAAEPATLSEALRRYAGFGPDASDIGAYARAAFARDVLQALDYGVDDSGIRVPERAVAWERAFPADLLVKLQAPMVRLDGARGTAEPALESEHFAIDPVSGTLAARGDMAPAAAVDFPGASWDPSPNYNARSGTAVREVIQHTTEGSFSGAISWFKNPSSQVSAHYVVSSSGQVVQMVREADRAWHAGTHNSHAIGIEHAGYANDPGTWTSAIVDTSAAITRSICARHAGVACSNAVRTNGNPETDVDESIAIKGHGMISGANRYDPGRYFDWAGYYALINSGGSGGSATLLDTFENGVGRFATSPAYSGSTTGISTASGSARDCAMARGGACALRVRLVDDAGSASDWAVRLLSGAGNPGNNAGLPRGGRIGFWAYAAGSGMRVAVGIDDSDGTERSIARALPANAWTYVEWTLSDAAQWDAWSGGNGAITASTATLDAIWLLRAQTGYEVNVYIDDVQRRD